MYFTKYIFYFILILYIVSDYGLDTPGIESRQEFFQFSSTKSPVRCIPGLSVRQSGRNLVMNTRPF